MTAIAHPITIDLRAMTPQDGAAEVFALFRQLGAGEAMELSDDHDPKALHARFMCDMPGKFAWDYLEKGQPTWRVAITRLALNHSNGGCCGGCGGA